MTPTEHPYYSGDKIKIVPSPLMHRRWWGESGVVLRPTSRSNGYVVRVAREELIARPLEMELEKQ